MLNRPGKYRRLLRILDPSRDQQLRSQHLPTAHEASYPSNHSDPYVKTSHGHDCRDHPSQDRCDGGGPTSRLVPQLAAPITSQGRASRLDPLGANARNGTTPKTVRTDIGQVRVDVPRDRAGTFEPAVLPKHVRRLGGFNEAVISLYTKGLTSGDITNHLADVYGDSASKELVSKVTDQVTEAMSEWQSRPLDPGRFRAIVANQMVARWFRHRDMSWAGLRSPRQSRGLSLSSAATSRKRPSGMVAKSVPFREVLPEQAVAVLVAAALPGRVGVGEVDPDPGLGLDAGVVEHLVALVPGQRAPQGPRELGVGGVRASPTFCAE